MALTRPKIWDLDTNIEYFKDPLTTLHQGATQANVDVGFIFNRANGLVSNVALYWSESANSFVTSFTTSNGVTDSNVTVTSYANLTIGSLLTINGAAISINGSTGSPGQVISTTGSGLAWTNPGGFSGGYVPYQSTFGGNLVANSTTASTSISTGALVVVGGAGISGNAVAGGVVSTFYGNVVGQTGGNSYVTGSLLPTANVSYDLGSPNNRWRTLYISGSTIVMGGATITTDTSGNFSFASPTGTSSSGQFATPIPTPTPSVEGSSGPNPILIGATLLTLAFLMNKGRNFLSSFNKEPPQS